MGRWSRAVGAKFLDWLTPPTSAKWLDVGCGTGAFTQLIIDRCAPASIAGIDPAAAQIEQAQKGPAGKLADFQVGDATALPHPTPPSMLWFQHLSSISFPTAARHWPKCAGSYGHAASLPATCGIARRKRNFHRPHRCSADFATSAPTCRASQVARVERSETRDSLRQDRPGFRCAHPGYASHRCHAIDLEIERAGPGVNEHEDARGRVFRKVAVVDRVEGGKIGRAGRAIDIALDDVAQRRACRLHT